MEALQFKLQMFEGPLDLLLHLIAKHKLDIGDIEISLLLEQYLDYIAQMKDADLEIATEFLAMAARLVYIKTTALLPRHEEESEKLREELSGQLIEYQLCKAIAGRMRAMYRDGVFVRPPQKLPRDSEYRLRHDASLLLEAYLAAAGRAKRRLPPPRSSFAGIVSRRIVPVETRILYVLKRLYAEGEAQYDSFFEGGDRSERVATFLAVLELVKSKRICLSEDNQTIRFIRRSENREEGQALAET